MKQYDVTVTYFRFLALISSRPQRDTHHVERKTMGDIISGNFIQDKNKFVPSVGSFPVFSWNRNLRKTTRYNCLTDWVTNGCIVTVRFSKHWRLISRKYYNWVGSISSLRVGIEIGVNAFCSLFLYYTFLFRIERPFAVFNYTIMYENIVKIKYLCSFKGSDSKDFMF